MAKVIIYSSDYCPFCSRAKALLEAKGVTDYEERVVDGQPAVRARMTEITGRTSVPQIFIGEHYVGGCDELHALEASGALSPMLT